MQVNPHTHHRRHGGTWLLALAAAAALSACANFSGIESSATPVDAAPLGLKNLDATHDADVSATDVQWWTGFADPQLNALVAQGLQNSPTLHVAQARLARTLAVTEVVRSADAPQIGAQLDLQRQRYTANGIFPPPIGGSVLTTATLQGTASWELDFFGKNIAALAASLGQSRAVQADASAASALLASTISRAYFQWVRLNAQLQLAQRTLEMRTQTTALVRERMQAGLDTELELQQSDSGIADAQLQIEVLQEQREIALNALAALTAQPVASLHLAAPALADIRSAPVASRLPLDLLGRRADITAARWRVEAATQEMGAAKAQFYPNINLVAFAGFSSVGFDKLLSTGSDQWGVGPAVRLPIFDGGRLRANLRGKAADRDAAVESYNAQVFEAVREVQDRVVSSQSIARQQAQQAVAQASAESAYAIALQRYQAGLGNYLNVLSAEAPVLTQRRAATDLAARALETRVLLLHALGGNS